MMTANLQKKAEEARSWFGRAKRDDGSDYWRCKDGAPDWVQEMCHKAHDSMLPDDWRYEFIVQALDALSEHEDEDEARDTLESDIYTADLCRWLGSHTSRPGYCDEAQEEGIVSRDTEIVQRLAGGQVAEKREVFQLVADFLRDLRDLVEEDEEVAED